MSARTALVSVSIASACFAGGTPPMFDPPVQYPVGDAPVALDTGDANGDGALDLLVGASTGADRGVSLLLGNGDGTFMPESRIDASLTATAVRFADLDGDGDLDIVATNGSGGSGFVRVFPGTGDGTFSVGQFRFVGAGPADLEVRDLDGDGILDLSVLNRDSTDLSVLLGNGDGTFQAETRIDLSNSPRSIDLADLNGDGIDDLVHSTLGASVVVRNGDGAGGFLGTTVFITSLSSVNDADVADLDNDGLPDIVATSYHGSILNVYFGQGGGAFEPLELVTTVGDAQFSHLADVNGDRLVDIVTVSSSGDSFSVILTNQDRTFAPPEPFITCDAPSAATSADFDGDLDADLIIACQSTGFVRARLNTTRLAPRIVAHPQATLASSGESVQLTVDAVGAPFPSVQWRRGGVPLADGGNVSGADSFTLTLSSVSGADEQFYDAVVTNTEGSVTSAAALLAVSGGSGGEPACPGDTDASGVVDFSDLVATIFLFGPCPE